MGKSKSPIVVGPDYRMKVINFLKIYGYYNGILVRMDMQRKYISGELRLLDIIQSKDDYKILKASCKALLSYCYDNNYIEIAKIMEYFYKVEFLELKKKYGNIFERMCF